MLKGKWEIRLLGTFALCDGGEPKTRCATSNAEVLLAYLAWNLGKSISRETVAEMLWPDREPGRALGNLRVALNSLRRQLEPRSGQAYVVIRNDGPHRISLNPDFVVCDVVEFRKLLARSPRDTPETRRDRLLAALDLYKGELMPGHSAPVVDEERQRLASELWDALLELSELIKTSDDVEQSLRVLRRLADENPYDEEVQCRLFAALAVAGRQSEIVARYQQLERMYAEVDASPPDELQDVYTRTVQSPAGRTSLRRKRGSTVGTPPEPLPEPTIPQMPGVPVQAPLPSPEPKRSGLIPLPVTRFFGREDELATLEALVRQGEDRLITLTGPGGTGKTRLATEFARRLSEAGGRQVAVISLAELESADEIPGQIVRVLHIPIIEGMDVVSQVVEYLAREPWLLVLDNLEQIATGAAMVIADLLEQVPSLIILATSRHALNVVGEQQMPIGPLPVPFSAGTPERLMEFASVQLFMDRASKVAPDLALTPRNAPQIAQLCRELEGLPLSLELAAGWAADLSVTQIVARLANKFELLVGKRVGLPARQASLLASLEWSYRLLTSELQRIFSMLAVFRGGWTLDAMKAVCGVANELTVISELRTRSFITVDRSRDETRYGMLEIVREFAAEKLAAEDAAFLANRHASYYARLAAEAKPHLREAEQTAWLERLGDEQDNLHAALRWSLENTPPAGMRMVHDLFFYWTIRGQWAEARKLLRQAVDTARRDGTPADLADMVMSAGVAARFDGDVQAAVQLAQESVELWRQAGDRRGTAAALGNLGLALQAVGNMKEAIATHEESLALAEAEADETTVSAALTNLSAAYLVNGELEPARRMAERALAMHVARGDGWAASLAQLNLGDIACHEDDAAGAWRWYRQSLGALVAVGDLEHAVHVLCQMAAVAAYQGRFPQAVALAGAAATLQERTGRPGIRDHIEWLAETLNTARGQLSEDEFQRAWADGAGLEAHRLCEFVKSLNGDTSER